MLHIWSLGLPVQLTAKVQHLLSSNLFCLFLEPIFEGDELLFEGIPASELPLREGA